jgi:hypothetical protein
LHVLAGVLERVFLRLGFALKEASASVRYLKSRAFLWPFATTSALPRSKLVKGEAFRGKVASKGRFFYGVRVHVVTTEAGVPVEFALLPGAAGDVRGLDVLPLVLPQGAEAYVDSAFTSYEREDAAREADALDFQVCYRRGPDRRQHPHLEAFKAADAPAHRNDLQRGDGPLGPSRSRRLLCWLPNQTLPVPARLQPSTKPSSSNLGYLLLLRSEPGVES